MAPALFAARLPGGVVELPLFFAPEAAPEAAAAFFGVILLGCLSGVLVVRMIPLDRLCPVEQIFRP